MSTATTSKVRTALVIGGGIAGPVAATALLKAGIQATVYEAYPTLAEGIGGGLALAPNGLAALGLIGADDAVRALATPITGTVMAVGGNSPQTAQPGGRRAAADRRPRRPAPGAARPGGRVGRPLRVRQAPGRQPTKPPDSVTAQFDDGATATADVLVGADGVRSTVADADRPGGARRRLHRDARLPGLRRRRPGPRRRAGVMTFAFGKRAYYLYWTQADGRVTWGANLPSKQYMSLTEARAIPAEQWLRKLRETYAATTCRASCWPSAPRRRRSTSPARSTSCRRSRTGTAAAWCWSATPCTRRRTAPARARRWRSRAAIAAGALPAGPA